MWLQFMLLLMSPISQGTRQAEFLIQPTRVTVKEGQPALFICSVKTSSPFESATVTWSDSYKTYQDSDDSILISEEFNTTVVTSCLQLLETSRYSRKYFKCAVLVNFRDGNSISLKSPLVGVDVQYFLHNKDIKCRRQPEEKFYREHENIDFKCVAPNTNPPLALKWILCSQQHSSFPAKQIPERLGDRILLDLSIRSHRHLHNEKVCCIATSSAFEGERVNCSLGPLQIIHGPYVEVIPDRKSLIPPIVSETRVRCNVISFPEVNTFSWSCNPMSALTSCESTGPYLNVSLANQSLNVGSENVTVTCTAQNMFGSDENTLIISVNYVDLASLDTCPVKNTINDSLLKGQVKGHDANKDKSLIVTRDLQSTGDVFHCSLNNVLAHTMSDTSMFQILWYMNGNIVQRSTFDSFNLSNDKWQFEFRHESSQWALRDIVACELDDLNRSLIEACLFDNEANHETSTIVHNTLGKPFLHDVVIIPETQTSQHYISQDTASATSTEEESFTIPSKTHTLSMPNSVSNSQISPSKIAWMLVVAVMVGFVLLACVVAVVLIAKKFLCRSMNTLDGIYQTTVPKMLVSSCQSSPVPNASKNGPTEDEPLYAIPDDDSMPTDETFRNYLRRSCLRSHDCNETIFKCGLPKEFRSSSYSSPGSLDSSTAEDEESYIRSSYVDQYSDISSSSGSHVYENKNVVLFGATDRHSAYYKAKILNMP